MAVSGMDAPVPDRENEIEKRGRGEREGEN